MTATQAVPRGFDTARAVAHLRRQDPALARWLQRIEPIHPDPRWQAAFDPVDTLARAILFQQLSGHAASAIAGRVEQAVGSRQLHADGLAGVDDDTLRACGVSANKVRALRDLVAHAQRGEIPGVDAMARLADEHIIELLTAVRGIGRWTAQMLLISRLGRPDVLPVDDLGVRKGLRVVDGLAEVPSPAALRERGACWAPFRSLAALALWEISDLGNDPARPVPRSQS